MKFRKYFIQSFFFPESLFAVEKLYNKLTPLHAVGSGQENEHKQHRPSTSEHAVTDKGINEEYC